MLQRKLLSENENPSKVFLALELGMIPVRFVIMCKRLSFLHHILNEPMESMIRQVFEEMKNESKKGDFYDLIKKDLKALEIKATENEINKHTKNQWKRYLKLKIKESALKHLIAENMNKRTKNIDYEELDMQGYLKQNKSKELSKSQDLNELL